MVNYIVQQMGISDQDSHLALTAPTLYVIRAYLYIHRILTGDTAAGQSQEYWPRVQVKKKLPISSPQFLVQNFGQVSTSHERPTHRVSPCARCGEVEDYWETGERAVEPQCSWRIKLQCGSRELGQWRREDWWER